MKNMFFCDAVQNFRWGWIQDLSILNPRFPQKQFAVQMYKYIKSWALIWSGLTRTDSDLNKINNNKKLHPLFNFVKIFPALFYRAEYIIRHSFQTHFSWQQYTSTVGKVRFWKQMESAMFRPRVFFRARYIRIPSFFRSFLFQVRFFPSVVCFEHSILTSTVHTAV